MTHLTGEEIKSQRLSLGLTQLEVANLIGTTPDMVSNWERGRNKIGNAYRFMLIEKFKQEREKKNSLLTIKS